MSLKFKKNREVDFLYHAIPFAYTGILHPKDKHRELVLVDWMGKDWIVAYRNNDLNKVGRHFKVKTSTKNGQKGFIHRGKFHPFKKASVVF